MTRITRVAAGFSLLLAVAPLGASHVSAQTAEPAGYQALTEQATNELATGHGAPAPPPAPTRAAVPEPAARAPEPHGTAVAGSLSFAAILPLEGYADETNGLGISGGVWIQLEHLVLEPRLGVEFDVTNPQRGYVHIPAELGSYALLPFSEHALFVGPGFGLHTLFESVDVAHTVGSAVVAQSSDTIEDDAFGFGLFARLGLVLARSSVVSFVPSVEYAITFADLIRDDREQAVRVNLSLLFGGGR